MQSAKDPGTRQEYLAKVVLITIFLGIFVSFAFWQKDALFNLAPFDFILLALATARLGKLVAYDVVAEPLRTPFARTVPDGTGAGESVEPRGVGVQKAIGQLITCPICAGTWIAAFLVYALVLFPTPARIFITLAAVIALAELLISVEEVFCWSAQLARTRTGALAKNGKIEAQVLKPLPPLDCDEPDVPEVDITQKSAQKEIK